MNAKTKKLALIGAAAVVLCAGICMALQAFNENLVFFFSPTQVAAKEAPVGRTFRLGGVVEKNSVVREKDGVTVHFRITDTAQTVNVEYKGILPDLFAEEQGVVDVPLSITYTHSVAVANAVAITKASQAEREKRRDVKAELAQQFKEMRGMLDDLGEQTATSAEAKGAGEPVSE